MFLKFALSHEAVTAVIPATGKPDRQSDNLKAGFGPLLTAAQQEGAHRAGGLMYLAIRRVRRRAECAQLSAFFEGVTCRFIAPC